MTLGAWRRWADHPSAAQLAERLTPESRHRWADLTGWLVRTYHLEGEVAWTDEDTGWVLRYRRSGRALATLLPSASGGLSALIIIGPSLAAAVDALPLSDATREAFSFATPYADGRWLWLRIHDDATVSDVKALIAVKAPPPAIRRRRLVVARELAGTR